jgi:hypothetical protein
MRAPRPFRAWLDDFSAHYYRRRPVNATFIGVHDHDHGLPDFSPRGVDETSAEMASLLARLHDGSVAAPETGAEKIDRTLAEHYLQIQQWEFASHHFQHGNPCVYTGEAIFSVIALFLRPFAPIAQRVEAAIARMEAIPAFLGQAQENVATAPPAWTDRAINECTGALHFFGGGIDTIIADEEIEDDRLRRAADGARAAFAVYRQFLETTLRTHPTDSYSCGADAFDMYLRLGHELDRSGDEVERYAREQFATARAALESGAAAFSTTDWRAALAHLADLHPTTANYLGRYREYWATVHESAVRNDLVTWPDYPIRYVPQPRWARAAAPHLYFLFYRAPAPLDPSPLYDYLVTPIEPEMPPEEQERRLRATNDSVIKLNHVIHHGGIGHHVQNWYAYNRATSRIGRIAAVDCATRIAMFCGGTMAEGWSSYSVDLMGEVGFLTDLERFSQHHARLRAAARAIVDVNLHAGRFTFDQAVAFYRDETAMTAAAAHTEAVKNAMFPGAAMMYLIGQDMIRDLRQETERRLGSAFSLRAFHDTFLSYGSIPVSIIARAMRGG